MLSPRAVILSLVAFAVVAVLWSAVSAWLPPDPDEAMPTTYSAAQGGYRAVMELLQTFDVPVKRSTQAPVGLFEGKQRVVLFEPDLLLLLTEHDYLTRMGEWLREGGELVLATNHLLPPVLSKSKRDEDSGEDWDAGDPGRREPPGRRRHAALMKILNPGYLEEVLGIRGLTIETVKTAPDQKAGAPVSPWAESAGKIIVAVEAIKPDYRAEASGTLEKLGAMRLALNAESVGGFTGDPVSCAMGTVTVEVNGKHVPVVLVLRRGKGLLTLIADTTVFRNQTLARADNAVLAYRLLAEPSGTEVVFDEYYHGVSIQGNVYALLGIWPYAPIAASILAAALLWAWANGVRFGPAGPAPEETRRNILEYVDAMASLFRRGRKYAFVLKTCRDGFVGELRRQLGLPPGTGEQVVMRAVERRHPRRADRAMTVLSSIDEAVKPGTRLSLRGLRRFAQELDACCAGMGSGAVKTASTEPSIRKG